MQVKHVREALMKLLDLVSQVLANAGNVGERGAALDQIAYVGAELADGASGVAIRAHAEGIGALNVEQIGDLVEDGCDSRVDDQHACPRMSTWKRTFTMRWFAGKRLGAWVGSLVDMDQAGRQATLCSVSGGPARWARGAHEA